MTSKEIYWKDYWINCKGYTPERYVAYVFLAKQDFSKMIPMYEAIIELNEKRGPYVVNG